MIIMLDKLMKMPRLYVYLITIYVFFLLIDIFYFFIPAFGYGLYAEPLLAFFTFYSLLPLVIFAFELDGKIDDEHYAFVRNVNYLLVIFFVLVTMTMIVPSLVI